MSYLNQVQGTGTEDGNTRLLNAYLALNSLWFWQQQHDYPEIFTIPLFQPPNSPDTEVIGGFQAKNAIPVSNNHVPIWLYIDKYFSVLFSILSVDHFR